MHTDYAYIPRKVTDVHNCGKHSGAHGCCSACNRRTVPSDSMLCRSLYYAYTMIVHQRPHKYGYQLDARIISGHAARERDEIQPATLVHEAVGSQDQGHGHGHGHDDIEGHGHGRGHDDGH